MEEASIEDEYYLKKEREKLRPLSKLNFSRSNIGWAIQSSE
jgi:hypothetical protein